MSLEEFKQAIRDIKNLVKDNPRMLEGRDFTVTLTVGIQASNPTIARSVIKVLSDGSGDVLDDGVAISAAGLIGAHAELMYLYEYPAQEHTDLESGQRLAHHRRDECDGSPCSLHNPSDHAMRDWPRLWSDVAGMMRVCEHGRNHPDPDHVRHETGGNTGETSRAYQDHKAQGCDGCCTSAAWDLYLSVLGSAVRDRFARKYGR